MTWYRVQGVIIYMPIRFCSCEFCDGHLDDPVTLQVDRVTQADSPTQAEDHAAEATLDIPRSGGGDYHHREEIKDWDWDQGPFTIQLPEDQFLRLTDAPQLIKEPIL